MEKWNDVLTRDIAWKVRDCVEFDEGNEVEIYCADGKQVLYFHKSRSEHKEDIYGEKKESDYGLRIEIAYSPELPSLDESGFCQPAKVLTFLWNYYLGYSVEVGYFQRRYYDYDDFNSTIFGGGNAEKKGEASLRNDRHYNYVKDRYENERPEIAGFEPVVGSKFYGNLMKFCEKMENLAKTGKKMKDDEFDSL